MLKIIRLGAIVGLCILLSGCVRKARLEDIVVPEEFIYDVQIISNNADDIDIRFRVGQGVDIAGGSDMYIYNTDDYAYLVSNGSMSVIDDGIDALFYSGNTGSYFVDTINDIVDKSLSNKCERLLEVGNGYRCYSYGCSYVDEDFGQVKAFKHADAETMELRRTVLYVDDLVITMTVSEYKYPEVSIDFTGVVTYDDAIEKVADSFIKENVYTYGKYTYVDSLIDMFNTWLGGQL